MGSANMSQEYKCSGTMILVLIFLLQIFSFIRSDNVLMVIGGQYFNASSREHDMVTSVEVIGQSKSCQVTRCKFSCANST